MLAVNAIHTPRILISDLPESFRVNCQAMSDAKREAAGQSITADSDAFAVVRRALAYQCRLLYRQQSDAQDPYTNYVLPRFIQEDLSYELLGNVEQGRMIAEEYCALRTKIPAHGVVPDDLEYRTVQSKRYIYPDGCFKVVSITGWSTYGGIEKLRLLGEKVIRAVARATAWWRWSHRVRCCAKPGEPADRAWLQHSSAAISTSRPICVSSIFGSRSTGRPSRPCCQITPSTSTAKIACMKSRCCSARLDGTAIRARRRSYVRASRGSTLASSSPNLLVDGIASSIQALAFEMPVS